jgi:hypothetical protein
MSTHHAIQPDPRSGSSVNKQPQVQGSAARLRRLTSVSCAQHRRRTSADSASSFPCMLFISRGQVGSGPRPVRQVCQVSPDVALIGTAAIKKGLGNYAPMWWERGNTTRDFSTDTHVPFLGQHKPCGRLTCDQVAMTHAMNHAIDLGARYSVATVCPCSGESPVQQ